MRTTIYIMSSTLTLLIGLALTNRACTNTSASAGFTKEEAVQRIGRRVYCGIAPDGERSVARSADGGFQVVEVGSRGVISGVEELSKGNYFVIVTWDERGNSKDWKSWFGKGYEGAGIIEEHLTPQLKRC